MEPSLKILFYLLWVLAGVIAGLFMRYASAKEGSVSRVTISMLLARVAVLLLFIFLVGIAMEITAVIHFKNGEMLPAGVLCVLACAAVYFFPRRK